MAKIDLQTKEKILMGLVHRDLREIKEVTTQLKLQTKKEKQMIKILTAKNAEERRGTQRKYILFVMKKIFLAKLAKNAKVAKKTKNYL
jgi:hypothetical protein